MSATTTRNAKADAALALLCERWPKCFFTFQGRRLPLKIGIHKDIPDGLIEPKILRLAFRLYVNNPGYLNATRLNVARIGLNGEPADKVDVKSAQAHLNWIRKFRKKRRREQSAQAAPPSASAPLPSAQPPPPPTSPSPSRDSLSTLREAARQREVQHDRIR